MEKDEGASMVIAGNYWRVKVKLPIVGNRESFEFKFVIDGTKWIINEGLPSGNNNNILNIPRH